MSTELFKGVPLLSLPDWSLTAFDHYFDRIGIFCYDAVNFDFPLNLFPGPKSSGPSEDWGIRMRGDQLARQWRVIRAIESSPNGLTVAEIAKREETGLRTISRDLEALQTAGFPLYPERVERPNAGSLSAFLNSRSMRHLPSASSCHFTSTRTSCGSSKGCHSITLSIPSSKRSSPASRDGP